MSKMIPTVLGPVPAENLGVTLAHEHLYCELFRVSGGLYDVLWDEDLVVKDLTEFTAQGGRTVWEMSTPDMGRSPSKLVRIATRAGINVLMGCGRYRAPFYEKSLERRDVNDIRDELIGELSEGVDGIFPAYLGEIGVESDYINPIEERVHRAVARAQRTTDVPIVTHSLLSRVGLDQVQLFEEEGVDPARIVVGHCDSLPDTGYHLALLRRGVYVSFDLIRGMSDGETDRQVTLILRLIDAGYGERIVLSQDVCRHGHLTSYGGHGYNFVVGEFVPRLLAADVPPAQIDQFLVTNPARILS